ncbi:MAG TPA: efflux RND transporter periplasmic adaptor subunit [Gemmatimonadaceae bacterium]|nr:efflux RND transporter periplasmic adaptor subunit [Gemmatimonadaceae bacterium]
MRSASLHTPARHAFRWPALALLLLAPLAGCNRNAQQALPIETSAVTRRTIVSEATASGQVEPINVIEVKSKSSGQIIEMPVETGSLVRPGDLLVQLDPRDVGQQLQQAQADLTAATARLNVAKAQKERNDKMFVEKIITAQEYEASQLDFANAEAAEIRARAAVDLAEQRVEEARVVAPVSGTIIEKPVALGQVIASATNSASGGTILLRMADLTKVRVRALFNETDIGAVVPNQPATVTVDAFPDRPFRGVVEKIEPQAIVQSSVTMFPVLVTLSNLEGLLKPGMNGEVTVLVDRREDVLAVPNDAVRTTREGPAIGRQLGLDSDSVQAAIQEQSRALMGGNGLGANGFENGGRSGRGGGPRNVESRGDVALEDEPDGQDAPRQGRQGGRTQLPAVSDADCQKVTDAYTRQPTAQPTLQALRGRMQAGEIDGQQMRAISDSIYRSLGLDGNVARACAMRGRGQAGNGGQIPQAQPAPQTPRAQPGGGESASAAPGGAGRRGRGGRAGGANWAQGVPVPVGEMSARTRSRTALVFIAAGSTYVPRVIRAGMSDLDFTEVLSGIEEGERVVLLSSLEMQAQRDSAMARMRSRSGGGMPGAPGGGGGGRGRGF